MSKSRIKKGFLCLDCKVDTGKIGEYYMLTDETWQLAHNSNKGMLCIGCIEQRIGRKLTPQDFNNSYVNRINPGESKSQRLVDRLGF